VRHSGPKNVFIAIRYTYAAVGKRKEKSFGLIVVRREQEVERQCIQIALLKSLKGCVSDPGIQFIVQM